MKNLIKYAKRDLRIINKFKKYYIVNSEYEPVDLNHYRSFPPESQITASKFNRVISMERIYAGLNIYACEVVWDISKQDIVECNRIDVEQTKYR